MRHTFWGVALALVALVICALPGTAGAKKGSASNSSGLMRITVDAEGAAQARNRVAIAPKLQYQLGLAALTEKRGSVRVIVETQGRPDVSALEGAGAKVEKHVGRIVQATVPVRALARVSRVAGVRFVRMPTRFHGDAISGEEVAASNAAASIQKGWTGKGVKVAIIDGGFGGYQQRILEGELPATIKLKSFCNAGANDFTENTNHGTAVAEIVHEMAPGAQLYLICYEFDADFIQAEQYAKSVGAQIISHSASAFNAGRGDGAPIPGTLAGTVADARQAGILWVNSAGNYAEEHWSGTFADTSVPPNGFHNFTPTSDGNGVFIGHNESYCAFLKWDEWPVAVSDYDLYLLNGAGAIVAASQTRQTGSQPPTEELSDPARPNRCFENTGAAGVFYLGIYAFRATTTPRLDLFSVSSTLQYPVPAGSVGDPGSSPFALTAGAICWQTSALEPYSGQGPTIDGRIKPDIAGQDANSGRTYGPFAGCGNTLANTGFLGTSASTPAVAGAAALVKEQNPTFTADQIQASLLQGAQDLGTPGPDNQFGAGKLFVPTPTAQGPTIADKIPPTAKAVSSRGVRGRSIKLLSQAFDETGEVRLADTIKKGARTITTLKTGFAATRRGATYYILWKPPASLFGALTHCVQAFDRTGNKSTVSCAALTIAKK